MDKGNNNEFTLPVPFDYHNSLLALSTQSTGIFSAQLNEAPRYDIINIEMIGI